MDARSSISPEAIPNAIRKAQEEFRSGNLAAAMARIDELFRSYPNHRDVLVARAILLANSGRGVEALELFKTLASKNLATSEALGWGSRLALDMHDFEAAEMLATKFAEVSPQLPLAHYYLANALRSRGKIEAGLSTIDKAIALDPNYAEAYITKAKLLEAWQMPGLAEDIYLQAMKLSPHPAAALALATASIQNSRPEDAVSYIDQVEAKGPLHYQLLQVKAEALTHLNREEAADKYWNLAATSSPSAKAIWQLKALVEIVRGRFDVAEEQIFNLTKDQGHNPETFTIYAKGHRMVAEDQDLVDRMSDLSRSVAAAPYVLADFHYAIGKSFDDLKDYERAIGHFDEANRICYALHDAEHSYSFDEARAVTDFMISWATPDRFASFPNPQESTLPLFIMGMMRSGTTLTETILSGHSLIKAGGEQSFWPAHGSEILSRNSSGFVADDNVLSELGKAYLSQLSRIAVRGSEKFVVDKNPANTDMIGFIHAALPHAKIIHTKRNAADTAISIWTIPVSREVRYAHNRQDIVFAYREYQRLMQHMEKVIPESRLRPVFYEELTSHPQEQISGLLEFIGVRSEPAAFHPENRARTIMTPSMFQARQPINRNSQERWRNYEPWLGEFAELVDL